MTLKTLFSGQRAESNQNVPCLIPLSSSVIRFSQHSWWTEWNSGIPAKVFRTQKAHWNSDVVSKCEAEPPLPSYTESIIILCVYCFTADCLVSIFSHRDDPWHVAPLVLTLQALEKLSVCRCRARMTCYLPTTYNARDMMVRGALTNWWMCSQAVCTHTRLKVFARIVAHLLSAWPRPWKQFINHYWLS